MSMEEEVDVAGQFEVQRGESKAKYLRLKPPVYGAAGYKIDDQYYTVTNSTVDDAECTYNIGKYEQSIGTNFGSTGNFIIPNSSFAGNVYLYLKLDLTGYTDISLPRGWGYAAIASLQYQMGSSNANQVQISGQSVFHAIMQQCSTVAARSSRLWLAGEEVNDDGNGIVEAIVQLPLPFSTAAGDGKLPLDTDMMGSQVFVNITFNQASAFIGGSGTKPTAFSSAVLTLRQGELTSKDVSLAPASKNQGLIYTYPMNNLQSYSYSAVSGASADTVINVALTGLTNGDLTAVILAIMQNGRLVSASGSSVSPFAPDRVRDVVVAFGGQVIFKGNGQSWRLLQADSKWDMCKYENSILSGTTAPFTSTPYDSEPIIVDFSRKSTLQNDYHMPNTKSYPNNTLTLQFKPPSGTAASTQYTIFATYIYNAALDFSYGTTTLLM